MFVRMLRSTLALPLLALASACAGGAALPEPVVFTPVEGTPITVFDPEFEPLPGADAHYGELNGGKYRIEIPHEWNGELVVYMRGSRENLDSFHVDPPLGRDSLVARGYAWATTSYDRQDYVTGAAADQSAALWDYFAREFGRPERSYAVGASMGGGAALISAERYSDRYDGALSACGVSGTLSYWDMLADYLAAGIFSSGMPREELFTRPIWETIYDHILPRLDADAERRELFENIWINLSGGRRPYGLEGFSMREAALWGLTSDNAHLYGNAERMYALDEWVGVGSDEFNDAVVRFAPTSERDRIPATEEITGEIAIPVVILHTTGDGIVPLSQVHYVEEKVAEAGRSHLLQVHLIEHPEHCGFTDEEYLEALRSLVEAVETRGDVAGRPLPRGGAME